MAETRVELAEIVLPEFGLPREEPNIPATTYETRIAAVRQRASDAGYDVLMVYADREHFANLAYLTGFDTRFEEALFPDYRNSFERVESRNNLVAISGYATCSEKQLDGPALWTAQLRCEKVAQWRVYHDTPDNRKRLSLE